MKIFEKKTKWIVLATYNTDGKDYIVFVRKGLSSGMLYFKVKMITPTFGSCSYNFRTSLVDIKVQFDLICQNENNR